MEVVFEQTSEQVANCYFYLAIFYYENAIYSKSAQCFEKAAKIVKNKQ